MRIIKYLLILVCLVLFVFILIEMSFDSSPNSDKSQYNEDTNIDTTKDQLNSNLQNASKNKDLKTEPKSTDPKKNSSKLFSILTSLVMMLVGIFIGLIIKHGIYQKKIKKKNERIKRLRAERNNKQYEIDRKKKSIIDKDNKIDKLKKKLSQSDHSINGKENSSQRHVREPGATERSDNTKISRETESSINKQFEQSKLNSTKKIEETRTITIYFTIPDQDGRFDIKHSSDTNDGKKFYKIEFNDNSSKGYLHYLSSQRDQQAIAQFKDFLLPVCNIENIDDKGHSTNVSQIQPGKVNLVNENWIVDRLNKVRIKLL